MKPIILLLFLASALYAQNDVSQAIDRLNSDMRNDAVRARIQRSTELDRQQFQDSMNRSMDYFMQARLIKLQREAAERADAEAFRNLRPPERPTITLQSSPAPAVVAASPAPRFQLSTANGVTLKLDVQTGETWQLVTVTNGVGSWQPVDGQTAREKEYQASISKDMDAWETKVRANDPFFFQTYEKEFTRQLDAGIDALLEKSPKLPTGPEMVALCQNIYNGMTTNTPAAKAKLEAWSK